MSIRAGGFRGQIPFGGIARGTIARGGIPYRQGGTAIDPLAFHALTYDPDTYKFLPFKTGTGPATQGRSSERYALNVEDIYYSVPAYEVGINGGRVVENEATYSEDLTNAAWVKTNGTATATVFTATSGNATCLQTLTKAASDRIYSCTIGRVTGTGTIEITTDGGTTWVDITSSVAATAKRFTCNKSAEVNPQYGARVVTSGDEISLTYNQNEDATGRADTTTPSEYCPTDLPIGAELFLDVFAATGVGWTDHGDGTASSDGSQVSLSTLRLFTSSLPQLHASFTVSNYSAGAVRPRSGGGGNGTWVSANGSYEEIISIGTVFDFQSDVDFIGTLSNISIKRPSVGYKVFANANGNTVASNVVTEAVGDPLVELPWYSACPAASNAQIRSNDIADAEWTATNVTVGDQDETGIDGNPASACTLTATAANGTVIANALVAASDDQSTCWYLKRKTGTGDIDLTLDNGGTWTTVTLDGTFQKFTVDQAALANPQIGIRIVVDTDAVIVGNAECYTARAEAEVRGLPPIFTAGAAVSTTADALSYDILNHSQTEGGYYFEYRPSAATSEISGDHQLLSLNNAVDLSYYDGTNGDAESTDGTNTATQAQALVAGTAYKIGIAYGDSELRVCVDGSWGTAATYDGAFPYGSALELFNAITHSGEMRDLHRYDLGYVAAQAQIDALMV